MFSIWSSLSLQAGHVKEWWLAPIVGRAYCGVERDLDVGCWVFYCPGAMIVCLKNSRESELWPIEMQLLLPC